MLKTHYTITQSVSKRELFLKNELLNMTIYPIRHIKAVQRHSGFMNFILTFKIRHKKYGVGHLKTPETKNTVAA